MHDYDYKQLLLTYSELQTKYDALHNQGAKYLRKLSDTIVTPGFRPSFRNSYLKDYLGVLTFDLLGTKFKVTTETEFTNEELEIGFLTTYIADSEREPEFTLIHSVTFDAIGNIDRETIDEFAPFYLKNVLLNFIANRESGKKKIALIKMSD